MACSKVKIFQLMEEVVKSILKDMNLIYIPHLTNGETASNITLENITRSTVLVGENISEPNSKHIVDVLSILLTGKCNAYVNLLGTYLFNGEIFSWRLLRVFLAFICALCVYSFKSKKVELTDELITCSAAYIQRKLPEYIGNLEGWKAFEKDSTTVVLKAEQSILTKKMQNFTLSREEQQELGSSTDTASEIESSTDSTSEFITILLERDPLLRKHRSSRTRDKTSKTTTDKGSVKSDFTFPKSVRDRNPSASSSKQYKSCPVDEYEFNMATNRVVCYRDLIERIVSLSIKVLRKVR